MATQKAKIFQTGGSQAVRLPAEYRFSTSVVYVSRIESSGDIVLSARPPQSWVDFVTQRNQLASTEELETFLLNREQPDSQERDPFADLSTHGEKR